VGGGQRCGLFRGGAVRQSRDDFDEVVLGIEVLRAAVGQKGVDEGVACLGFEAAEEHPVFHAELGGVDHVLSEVGVDSENSLAEAIADFFSLVEGVAKSLGDIAGGTLGFVLLNFEAPSRKLRSRRRG
jgi:hypothetical protein